MQNQMIRLAVHTQTFGMAVAERAQSLRERAAEERGQTAAEYLGIILLVAVIIAAVVGTGVAGDIADRIQKLVENIGKGEKPEGAPAQ